MIKEPSFVLRDATRAAQDLDTFKVPVLLMIFNRPRQTSLVFDAIRKAKPARLYIASDGPRKNRKGEEKLVDTARQIAMAVDWECEVHTNFREANLGCAGAVVDAINWFFESEEMGIILEDDILPSESFFPYCEHLLKRYKDDYRISMISGYNKFNSWYPEANDYFFAHTGGIWGWATWRRSWQNFNIQLNQLDDFAKQGHLRTLFGFSAGRIRERELRKAKLLIEKGKISSWDYGWALSRHINSGLVCVPSVSLTKNIGFGEDSTHTKTYADRSVKINELDFPIRDNPFVIASRKYDRKFLSRQRLPYRLLRFAASFFNYEKN